MSKTVESVAVAKSKIYFETADEWFKTLVSGVVENFFPDRKLTFSIEMKPLRSLGGYCAWYEKPSHIVINSRHKNDGVDIAGIVAHEIVHLLVDKDIHGKEFQKEAKKAGLIMTYWNGYTEPTQKFAEKVVPTLEKCGYKAVYEGNDHPSWLMNLPDDFEPFLKFVKPSSDLWNKNLIGFEKKKNGKWGACPCFDSTGVAVDQRAVDTVCRQMEFLDKNVFAGQVPGKKPPFRFLCQSDAIGLADLFDMLNHVYFRKNSKKYKASFQAFYQLMKDEKTRIFDVNPVLFVPLGDSREEKIFALSKPKDDFYFSLSAQRHSFVSENQITQIRNLCLFLNKCLFWLKQPVKPSVLIRANRSGETVEEYCSYLSKKMAELFGVDPDGIRESEYLPFLEGFGDLISENKTTFWRTVYRRVMF